jgi:hypothetical protein
MNRKLPLIEVGYQVYLSDGDDPFGAVRDVLPMGKPAIRINIENAGDFMVPLDAIETVHSQKVLVKMEALPAELQRAIRHAHDREEPEA